LPIAYGLLPIAGAVPNGVPNHKSSLRDLAVRAIALYKLLREREGKGALASRRGR